MKKQRGQIIIILLLIIVVALAIGLSIVGRSTSEIATSTKTEQSSRAFSAAEAGIERAIQESNAYSQSPTGPVPSGFTFSVGLANQSSVVFQYNLPIAGQGLEYPPFGKESYAQFWLANPGDLSRAFADTSFQIYFGQVSSLDSPAIEVNVIMQNGNGASLTYESHKFFFDSDSNRALSNHFQVCSSSTNIPTNYGASRSFLCFASIDLGTNTNSFYPVLARVRILYSDLAHPVAISGNGIPAQARMFTSVGRVGNTKRTIQVFQQKLVLPQFLDYALFSANQVTKS